MSSDQLYIAIRLAIVLPAIFLVSYLAINGLFAIVAMFWPVLVTLAILLLVALILAAYLT